MSRQTNGVLIKSLAARTSRAAELPGEQLRGMELLGFSTQGELSETKLLVLIHIIVRKYHQEWWWWGSGEGGSCSIFVVGWIAGELVEQLILHLGHGLYFIIHGPV